MSDDPVDLNRFVEAQAPVYDRVVAELKRGRKESHWIWFIFPQAPGLGRSAMSVRYAIRSPDEARAWCSRALGRRWRGYFCGVNAMKSRSSMEL